MATGQAKLFGTIQMTNFPYKYSGGKINGLSGESLGKSDNAVVNGIKAYIGIQVSIAEATTPEDACANSPTAHYVAQIDGEFSGEINTGTAIFDNYSGFTQSGLAGKYVRQENIAATYQVDSDFRAREGYFLLNYVTDCRG
jgi:hypothetical protein